MFKKMPVGLLAIALTVTVIVAQDRTVGLMLNEEGSFEGYTLFSNVANPTTYLINNEGLQVNSWESEYYPGLSVYLSNDGYLYRPIVIGETSRFDDWGGGVEKLDWEGNVVWRYQYRTEEYCQHHDIEVLPSGNVLLVAWGYKDTDVCIAEGRDPNSMNPDGLWPDHIVEIEPVGADGGNIVWEWHVWDHLIQDFDPAKNNYGVVGDHPELVDINHKGIFGESVDWTHFNSVAYNAGFDQIIVSSREFSEFWVIDHSTTTAEARGHTGGTYGKGGDILYRWGNPQTYRQGTQADRQLFEQHDPYWIPPGYPGAGNIMVFDNYGLAVDEIEPPVDEEGNYILTGNRYGPTEPLWSYDLDNSLYSFIFSGAQRLPNGNTLICYGTPGTFVEITPQGDEVWRYINPVVPEGPLYQGDTLPYVGANTVFKIHRYTPDFPGFEGKDLTPGDPVEKYHNASKETDSPGFLELALYPNVFSYSTTATYQLGTPGYVQIKIYDAVGQEVRTILEGMKSAGTYHIPWDGTDDFGQRLTSGVYFFKLLSNGCSVTHRIILTR